MYIDLPWESTCMKGIPAVLIILLFLTAIPGASNETGDGMDDVRRAYGDFLHGFMERDHFVENGGQLSRDDIRFHTMGKLRAGFTDDSIVYALDEEGTFSFEIVFEDSNEVEPVGLERKGTRYNFFLGNDPSRWQSDLSCCGKVLYRDLWDGIDLLFYPVDGSLKYDILVHPGASTSDISFRVVGASFDISEGGRTICFETPFGTLEDGGLTAYQEGGEIPVEFVRYGSRYKFFIEDRNPEEMLIIDPLVQYCTYLGGSSSERTYSNSAVKDGNVYLYGTTYSSDFPAKPGTITPFHGSDLFVTCMNDTLDSIIFSTFIGGNGTDYDGGIQVDESGNIFICGTTYSKDFPTTKGTMNETSKIRDIEDPGGWTYTVPDIFISRISPSGSSLVYSTFAGGNMSDEGSSIDVDSSGHAYVTGRTQSKDLYLKNPYDDELEGEYDLFVMKLEPDGSDAVFSTYLGGNEIWYEAASFIRIDAQGNPYVCGISNAWDFPTTKGSYMTSLPSGWNPGILFRLSSNGQDLDFSTFLGGENSPSCIDLTSDSIFITGTTYSPDLDTTPDAFDDELGGRSDAFLMKMDRSLSTMLYCTYLGGSSDESSYSVNVFGDGAPAVGGFTFSSDFPLSKHPLMSKIRGDASGFATFFTSDLGGLSFSSYFGGDGEDEVRWIYQNDPNNLYITGITSSKDLPVHGNAYDDTVSDYDMYAARIKLNSFPPTPPMNLTSTRGDENITLHWDPPLHDGNETITNYTIYMSPLNRSFEEVGVVEPDVFTFIHMRLDNGKKYYYYVTANNIAGESLPSRVTMGIPARPPSVPEILSINGGNGSVRIEWSDPPDCGGDPYITFNVYMGTSSDSLESVCRELEEHEYTMTGLENGKTYFFSISASNSMGEGPDSTPFSVVPMKLPSAPRNLTCLRGPRYIHLFWDGPADSGGDANLFYSVYISEEHGDFSKLKDQIGGHDFNATGLVNGRLYHFKVAAVNEKGEGPKTEVLGAIPLDVPLPPENVHVINGNMRAQIEWDPPSYTGGDDTVLYNVYLSESDDDSSFEPVAEGLDSTEYRISSLENGLKYYVRVTTANDLFESEPCPSIPFTPIGPPSEPVDLEVELKGADAVLRWSAPLDNGGGPIFSYNIYSGPTEHDLMLVGSSTTETYTITEMEPGRKVFIAVNAENPYGPGPLCDPVQVLPLKLPGMPTILKLRPGNGTITVFWEDPKDLGGSSELSFNIYMSTDHQPLERIAEGIRDRSYTIEGLTCGVEYAIGISAVTEAGEGIMSYTDKAIPFRSPPEPLSITVTGGRGSINITWQLPENDGGRPITEVRIYRWRDNEERKLIARKPSEPSFHMDREVLDGVRYNYIVFGVSEGGTTPPSEVVSGMARASNSGMPDLAVPLVIMISILGIATISVIIYALRKDRTAGPPRGIAANVRPFPTMAGSTVDGHISGNMEPAPQLPRGPVPPGPAG